MQSALIAKIFANCDACELFILELSVISIRIDPKLRDLLANFDPIRNEEPILSNRNGSFRSHNFYKGAKLNGYVSINLAIII